MSKVAKKVAVKKARKAKTYEEMTPAERRVAVAKDVLKQLDAKKYKAKQGTYFYANLKKGKTVAPDEEVRDALKKFTPCEVCAKGAAIVSAARVFDRLKVVDGLAVRPTYYDSAKTFATFGEDRPWEILNDIFDEETADKMESVFEWHGHWVDFAPKMTSIKSPAGRLRAIFKNIIRNKGDFIPT